MCVVCAPLPIKCSERTQHTHSRLYSHHHHRQCPSEQQRLYITHTHTCTRTWPTFFTLSHCRRRSLPLVAMSFWLPYYIKKQSKFLKTFWIFSSKKKTIRTIKYCCCCCWLGKWYSFPMCCCAHGRIKIAHVIYGSCCGGGGIEGGFDSAAMPAVKVLHSKRERREKGYIHTYISRGIRKHLAPRYLIYAINCAAPFDLGPPQHSTDAFIL